MYIQVVDNVVNLIGSKDVGLPLPQTYLDDNPHVLCLDSSNYDTLPKVGYFYSPDTDTFSAAEPNPETPQEPIPTPLETISEQLKALSEKYENDQSYTQEMMLTLASAIAEVYERLDAESSK